jgi:hypothetical protein
MPQTTMKRQHRLATRAGSRREKERPIPAPGIRKSPRANPPVEEQEVQKGVEKLAQVLGN